MRRIDLVRCFQIVVVLSLARGAMSGQTASASSTGYTLHVFTDLIEVPVLALKAPFQPARSLKVDDFEIRLDGGREFHPRNAHVEGKESLSLTFLIADDSKDAGQLSQALREGVDAWPKDLSTEDDRVTVLHPACGALLAYIMPDAADALAQGRLVTALSRDQSSEEVLKLPACQRPSVAKSLQVGIERYDQSRNWKVIVVLLNGERFNNVASLAGLQELAAARGVTLFAVKYLHEGSFPSAVYSATEGINVLVSSTGGVTLASSFADLGEVIATIVGDVRARYVLSFPRPSNGTAGLHRIEVRSNVKGVRVISAAASAPLMDSRLCDADLSGSTCTTSRPQYGPERRSTVKP